MILVRGDRMIKSNLKILLAENNIRISKISNDTGISRTTLTALSENHLKGIQLDTMNKLCKYLRISPSDLFAYAPVDITPKVSNIEVIGYNNDASDDKNAETMEIPCTLFLNFDTGMEKFSVEFEAVGRYFVEGYDKLIFNFLPVDNGDTLLRAEKIINNLPKVLKNDVYQSVSEMIDKELRASSTGNNLIELAQLLDRPSISIEFES